MVKNKLTINALMLLISFAALLGACKKSTSEEQKIDGTNPRLRFVLLADSRGDSLGYTVDSTDLNPIIRCIDTLKPQPSFLVFGGDMCYRGYLAKHYTFQEFKNLVTNQSLL